MVNWPTLKSWPMRSPLSVRVTVILKYFTKTSRALLPTHHKEGHRRQESVSVCGYVSAWVLLLALSGGVRTSGRSETYSLEIRSLVRKMYFCGGARIEIRIKLDAWLFAQCLGLRSR